MDLQDVAEWTFNVVDLMIVGSFGLIVGWALPKVERKDKK